MTEIRAFVGHSFTADDTSVVGEFLKFFDQLSKMNPAFSWVHAEAAEPKLLTDKVLSLIKDRNLFIGICTKKEPVIDGNKLLSVPFSKNRRILSSTDIRWKTSDWIIQEIGMAKGLGLELILLMEEGIRRPGGLQGDVEYILFERDAPEKSFGKVVEMITALTPKSLAVSPTQSVPASSKDNIETNDSENAARSMPKPDWDREKYGMAMFHMIVRKDKEGTAQINAAFLSSPHANTDTKIAAWNAHNEFCEALVGKEGEHLDKLKMLAEQFPDEQEVRAYYARALRLFDKHFDAAVQFEAASKMADAISDKLNFLGQAANEYSLSGKLAKANILQNSIRKMALDCVVEESDLLHALQNASPNKEDIFSLAISERLAELKPDDFGHRFKLAYSHSQHGNEDIALHHYIKIPQNKRSAVGWNNLGVSFDHFQISGMAVAAYRKSEEMDETLAMSNLGFKFVSAGFLKEAQEICDKALSVKDYHKNVGHLLARIKDNPDEEETKKKEILKGAASKIEFYRQFGRAIGGALQSDLTGNWTGKECLLRLESLPGDKIRLSGSYEREAGLYMALGLAGAQRMVRHQIEFNGEIRGRAIVASLTRANDAAPRSLLDGIETKVLMFVGEHGKEIKVVENPSSSNPVYYSIFREGSLGKLVDHVPSKTEDAR